jgi:ABC-2 type transport system permease protein
MRRASLEMRRADPQYPDARPALHAEWTKTRTVGGTFWLLLAVMAATVALGVTVSAAARCPMPGGCGQGPARVGLSGIYLGQAVVAILAVQAIGGEYGTGMIRVTWAAMPQVGRVNRGLGDAVPCTHTIM